MPIYEYHCERCGQFEVTQRITEDALKRCPECRGKVQRLLSQTSFALKGSGWYKDLYGSKGSSSDTTTSNSAAKADAKSETKADAKPETKSDAKPESKTDAKLEKKPDPKPERKPGAGSKKSGASASAAA